MEHMKRMLVVAVAVILAGVALMYAHRHMYKNCADNVQVQSYSDQMSPKYQRYTPGSMD